MDTNSHLDGPEVTDAEWEARVADFDSAQWGSEGESDSWLAGARCESCDTALLDLEWVTVAARRAIAQQYAHMVRLIRSARQDPEPWVGPDPTQDRIWRDPRGRSVEVVRRERREFAERAAVADVAVRLRISEQTVYARVARCEVLIERCSLVWHEFLEGRCEEASIVALAQLALSLPVDAREAWAAFDAACAEACVRLTPAKLRVRARAVRERVHAESVELRHTRARADRGVWLEDHVDGMSTIILLTPADAAHAAFDRVDSSARSLGSARDEPRTLAQLRADIMADLLKDGRIGDLKPAGRPSVAITVPVLTLLGGSDEPAVLDGHGPIDIDTARRLAGEASSWVRVLTHPVSGTVLDLDRTTYRVPKALRRWLGVMHSVCTFPGCRRSARECDIDHRVEWHRGGSTSAENLAPECESHHRLRHESSWDIERDADGTFQWTSPSGAVTPEDPPPF